MDRASLHFSRTLRMEIAWALVEMWSDKSAVCLPLSGNASVAASFRNSAQILNLFYGEGHEDFVVPQPILGLLTIGCAIACVRIVRTGKCPNPNPSPKPIPIPPIMITNTRTAALSPRRLSPKMKKKERKNGKQNKNRKWRCNLHSPHWETTFDQCTLKFFSFLFKPKWNFQRSLSLEMGSGPRLMAVCLPAEHDYVTRLRRVLSTPQRYGLGGKYLLN